MSHPLDEDHHSNVAVCQVGATRDDLLTTPFIEDCFSQFVVETPNSYPDLSFLNELILRDSEATHIGTYQPSFATDIERLRGSVHSPFRESNPSLSKRATG